MSKASVVDSVDFDVFAARATEALDCGNITRMEDSYTEKKWHSEEMEIRVPVKTSRVGIQVGEDDFDFSGTEWPTQDVQDAADKLASEFGLAANYCECEKGWGTFHFSAPETK